jgi:Holliday junction DNA helicase RuvA
VIGSLRGHLAAKGDGHIIVDVGGVGFKVFVPPPTLDSLGGVGQQVILYTHMHVRENELSLYGFRSSEELRMFELLLGVSGIGPKVGLKIVSMLTAQSLSDAISRGDASMLTRIPGVGRKTAERMMVELKDKLGFDLEFVSYPALTHADAEAISALTSLGYSVNEAQTALRSLPRAERPVEETVRLALQYFARE